jgi:hypothetical protein
MVLAEVVRLAETLVLKLGAMAGLVRVMVALVTVVQERLEPPIEVAAEAEQELGLLVPAALASLFSVINIRASHGSLCST